MFRGNIYVKCLVGRKGLGCIEGEGRQEVMKNLSRKVAGDQG